MSRKSFQDALNNGELKNLYFDTVLVFLKTSQRKSEPTNT